MPDPTAIETCKVNESLELEPTNSRTIDIDAYANHDEHFGGIRITNIRGGDFPHSPAARATIARKLRRDNTQIKSKPTHHPADTARGNRYNVNMQSRGKIHKSARGGDSL